MAVNPTVVGSLPSITAVVAGGVPVRNSVAKLEAQIERQQDHPADLRIAGVGRRAARAKGVDVVARTVGLTSAKSSPNTTNDSGSSACPLVAAAAADHPRPQPDPGGSAQPRTACRAARAGKEKRDMEAPKRNGDDGQAARIPASRASFGTQAAAARVRRSRTPSQACSQGRFNPDEVPHPGHPVPQVGKQMMGSGGRLGRHGGAPPLGNAAAMRPQAARIHRQTRTRPCKSAGCSLTSSSKASRATINRSSVIA